MEKFEASSGLTFWINEHGDLVDDNHPGGRECVLNHLWVEGVREFFQAERDEDAGLWRSKADPTWTARRKGVVVYFSNEDHERQFYISLKSDALIKSWSADLQAIGREYLEANPEPKPWHEAKDGHLWLIRFDDYPETDVSALVKGGRFIYNDHCHEGVAELDDSTIVAGRRIWPPEPD